MLSIESMDHIVPIYINLVIHVNHLFNELNELSHLLSKQKLDMVVKLFPKQVNPLFARSILRSSETLRADHVLATPERPVRVSGAITVAGVAPESRAN